LQADERQKNRLLKTLPKPVRLNLETQLDRCRTVGALTTLLEDIARENEWANGHHESAEISCVAVEDTLSSPEEKSLDGEDAFIRELSQRIYSRFPLTENPQNDYDLPPRKSSLSDDNVDYDTSPTLQCNQQSSFVRSFSRFKPNDETPPSSSSGRKKKLLYVVSDEAILQVFLLLAKAVQAPIMHSSKLRCKTDAPSTLKKQSKTLGNTSPVSRLLANSNASLTTCAMKAGSPPCCTTKGHGHGNHLLHEVVALHLHQALV
jgi:hypothetical protein